MIIWIILLPVLKTAFKTESVLPFLVFTPVWYVGILVTVDRAFLTGNHLFNFLAFAIISEPFFKIVISIVFVTLGYSKYIYAAIPLSILLSFFISYFLTTKMKTVERAVDTLDVTNFCL